MISKEELEEYYTNHTAQQCAAKFGVSDSTIANWVNKYNIPKHTYVYTTSLGETGKPNPNSVRAEKVFNEALQTIKKDECEQIYRTSALSGVMKKFNIGKALATKIIEHYNIPKLTRKDTKRIHLIEQFGSYEDGCKAMHLKAMETSRKNGTIESSIEKRNRTNLEKYGSISPLGNKAVREKSHNTVKNKYGVDNVFQATFVKEKIKQTQIERYGGIGFASPQLNDAYKSVMVKKYGVEYGCLLPQCSLHGGDSQPNSQFAKLLDQNEISYEREFVLDNKRYDFKVNNVLVEINPTFTHTSSEFSARTVAKDRFYHMSKSKLATDNGYRCICVWDWDNINSIINLLKDRQTIYARKCTVKEISTKESNDFLSLNHIQGKAKSDIQIGLFYEDSLISVMTFGTPRYNKRYEYELIRYCSTMNVLGGANKLFSYFTKTYKPNSIISYCDLSKFTGSTYIKLGFKTSKRSIKPSRHWYNLKTKRHITDNLLRARGFDQLFGKEYGVYGKNTSNEELMKLHDFIDLYDCGQQTFIWNKE